DDLVHEGFEATGTVEYLKGHALQYPFRDLGEYLRKMSRYSSLMAEQMATRGRRFHAHQLVTHPAFTFFKMYGLRQGFRDGMPGLILSLLYAYYTFVKYAKLWERTRASA
ncbi:MAG: glycosyltransferase family 2 protein, partial [Nitrospirota bacterium]